LEAQRTPRNTHFEAVGIIERQINALSRAHETSV